MPEVLERLPAGPAYDGRDTEFWEGLRAGELRQPRCTECGTWRPVGRAICAHCWSFATTWEVVPAEGTVFTWVRTHRPFMSELDVAVPYVTAVVELNAAPLRLLGIVVDLEHDPRIGDRVVGEIQHPANSDWPVLRWRLA